MIEENKRSEIQKSLIDWCKWVIGINFSAATGCIIALNAKVPPDPIAKIAFLLAIFLFASNVVLSVRFTFQLALQKISEKKYTLSGFRQIWVFMAGLGCLFAWILLKSFNVKTDEQKVQIITQEKTAEIKIKDEPIHVSIEFTSP